MCSQPPNKIKDRHSSLKIDAQLEKKLIRKMITATKVKSFRKLNLLTKYILFGCTFSCCYTYLSAVFLDGCTDGVISTFAKTEKVTIAVRQKVMGLVRSESIKTYLATCA